MFDFRGKCVPIAMLGLLSALCVTRVAEANTYQCLPGPALVPGLSGAPEWQDFNADGFWRPQLDDPRWAGGAVQYLSSLPVGGQPAWASQVSMRAITVGKIVYVLIQAAADDNGPTFQDSVYVAFSQGNALGAYALGIDLNSNGQTIPIYPPANPAAGVVVPADNPLPTPLLPASVVYYQSTNATTDPAHPSTEPVWGGENDGIPSWLQGARWDRPTGDGPRWAITLRIDLSAMGLNTSGITRFFFGATVHNSTGDITVGNVTPKVGADVDRLDVTPVPKRSDLWQTFDQPGTACTPVVTVDPADIGVWTGNPGVNGGGTLTNQICTGSGCAATENTFRVTIRNVPNGGGIGPWDLRVRFRLADWASSSAYQADAPWSDIATTPTPMQILLAPVQAYTTANGWYWAPPVDAGDGTSSVTIDYKCAKGGAAFCPHLTDMSALHQALFAEISNPSAAWTITTSAAYRSMDFTTAAGSGGTGGAGGASSGGASSGGASSGGTSSGGTSSGGVSSGGASSGGASSGGASSGGASSGGASSGGASGASGAAMGGVPSGGGGGDKAGSVGESEAGDTSVGGTQNAAGTSNSTAGTSAVGVGGTGNGGAGSLTAPPSGDKGSSCEFRRAERQSSRPADFAALLGLGIAVRRRRRNTLPRA